MIPADLVLLVELYWRCPGNYWRVVALEIAAGTITPQDIVDHMRKKFGHDV